MRTATAWVAEQQPRRSTPDDSAGSLRRGELAAGLATAALVGQLLFAPVTLLMAATLVAVGRVSRWRPQWLLAPAIAGLIWMLETGIPRTAADFVSGSRQLAGYLLAAAVDPARLAHPGAAFAGAAAWLPRQLPLALLAAASEASIELWLGWSGVWRGAARPAFRAGLVALARRRVSAAALSAGRTVTADGCALGLEVSTGRLAGFSWSMGENGVLLTGANRADLDQLGLAAACAALRLRKTVLLADLTGAGLPGAGPSGAGLAGAGLPGRVTALATSLDIAASEISSVTVGAEVAGLAGRAVRRRGVVVISARTGDGARQVIDDLANVLASLRDLSLRADCLVWISGCEVVDEECLAGLVRLGAETGTAVLLSTTSASRAAGLAAVAGTLVAAGPISGNLAEELSNAAEYVGREIASAALRGAPLAISRPMTATDLAGSQARDYAIAYILRAQPPGMFAILKGRQPGAGPLRLTTQCRTVPITSGNVR